MRKAICTVIATLFTCTFFSLTGCSSAPSSGNVSDIKTYIDFIDELKSTGYKVEEIKPLESDKQASLFSVTAKFIDVDRNRISVYEFSDSDMALSQSETISEDGSKIGNTKIDWIDKPHFYHIGNLIVGYTDSKNKELHETLEKLLGTSVTN